MVITSFKGSQWHIFFVCHRPSGDSLAQAVLDGIVAVGGTVKDYGIVTTPQLHYFVVCDNTKGAYGVPTIQGYYEKLAKAFNTFRGQVSWK